MLEIYITQKILDTLIVLAFFIVATGFVRGVLLVGNEVSKCLGKLFKRPSA